MASDLHPVRIMRSTSDDVILYLVIGIVGFIPIAIAIGQRSVFGTQSTIGLLMLGVAIGGLLAMRHVAGRRRRHR